jgi:hypothetical protein
MKRQDSAVGGFALRTLNPKKTATLSFTCASKDRKSGACLDPRKILATFSIIGSGIWLVSLAGCGGTMDPPQKSQHVVIIFRENRTPDNLFHNLPNADIAVSGVNSHGQTIPLTPVSLATPYDLDHSHVGFVAYYLMEKWTEPTPDLRLARKTGHIARPIRSLFMARHRK